MDAVVTDPPCRVQDGVGYGKRPSAMANDFRKNNEAGINGPQRRSRDSGNVYSARIRLGLRWANTQSDFMGRQFLRTTAEQRAMGNKIIRNFGRRCGVDKRFSVL